MSLHPHLIAALNALSPLGVALLDEPEIREHRDALAHLATAQATWTEREEQRLTAHRAAVARWEDDTRTAALTGQPTPPVPGDWTPDPAGNVFETERQRIAEDIARTYQAHAAEITGRHLAADLTEHADLTAEHAALTRRTRQVTERLRLIAQRVRRLQVASGLPVTDLTPQDGPRAFEPVARA